MRLSKLEPRWISISRWDDSNGTQHYLDNPPRVGGISFYCPIHTKKCNCCNQLLPQSHRLAVFFSNPIDNLPPQYGVEHLWNRSGDSFDNLTLNPSIDASSHIGVDGIICWHGFIQNGEIK